MIPFQRDGQKRPKYQMLADWVRQQVQTGELQPEQQLLSYAEIEAQLGFSQNTVERAYAILEEEGLIYRAHGRGVFVKTREAARSDTGFIGYIDKEFKTSKNFFYYTLLMRGAQQVADEAGKQLVVISSVESFTKWEHLEGVVLCSAGHDPSFSGNVMRGLIPDHLAVVNSLLPDKIIPSVVADDSAGIFQAIEHLVGLGHRRIAYLSQVHYEPRCEHPLVQIRHQAYLNALHHHLILPQPEWVYSPRFTENLEYYNYGFQGMSEWLQEGWKQLGCTAILAHNDLTALGAIDALHHAGISVPEEVSVVGFDGVEISQTAAYHLTTVRVPLQEIGTTTMKVLLQHIQNPLRTPKVTTCPVELVTGGTTGPLLASPTPHRLAVRAGAITAAS